MQMSRERFQEVHKLIWNTVIARFEEVKKGECSVQFLKSVGMDRAYKKGLLDLDEAILLSHNSYCLLCASDILCRGYVLGGCLSCGSCDSLYYRANFGDKDAMIKIRDIVDKEPFTELTIVTLYDRWEE